MSSRKNLLIILGFVISVSLITASLSALLVSYHADLFQFDMLNTICSELIEQEPETLKPISAALKEYTRGNPDDGLHDGVLFTLGYRVSDFSGINHQQNGLFAIIGLIAGVSLFLFTFLKRNRAEANRIRALAEYLEQVNNGKAAILLLSGEDDFSRLEDEIYKTVTYLYQTKEQAVQAKNDILPKTYRTLHIKLKRRSRQSPCPYKG